MRTSHKHRRRAKPARPGWDKSLRKEGTGYPSVAPKLRWVGRPLGDDSYNLKGMTLELVWYATPEDRQVEQNECLVSLISIDSCEESKTNDAAINMWCEDKATRCDCGATLVEMVDEESLYGQWLRQQSHLGYQSLKGQTELITPLRMWLIFGRPNRSAVRRIARSGVNLVPNTDNLLDIQLVDPAPSALSSLQVDRLIELYEEVGAYVPHASSFLRERERKCARLKRGVRALRSKEDVLETLLVAANAKLDKSRSVVELLSHRLSAAESDVSAIDERIRQSHQAVSQAESELQRLERFLRKANRARVTSAHEHGPSSDEFKAACERAKRMKQIVDEAVQAVENAKAKIAQVEEKAGIVRSLANERVLASQRRLSEARPILDACQAEADRADENYQVTCRTRAKLRDQICRLGGDA